MQHLERQIFPSSKIMARRWLRSPRIRNTFMVRPALSQLLGNFLAGEAAATSPAPASGSRAPARAPELRAPARAQPLRQRALGEAVTWPSLPPCQGARKRRRPRSRDPASRPSPAPRLPGRGGAAPRAGGFRPGPASRGLGPPPAARAAVRLRGACHVPPAPPPIPGEGSAGSPGLCLLCSEPGVLPHVTVGKPLSPSLCRGSLICTQG